ncbi:FAD-dependent oxidoreductase [Bradyrhizobium sp. BRP22]|uniref:flavin monoamine oxidase family protein n=1 Tax=Bradyrhizobium sp. BRP22 TaxID=2793821 RepID=UPI001CD70E0F|nr:FAD-dependent oxidoreductase [Bradyrhizobium sp. BRP22]MCA1455608.1 FAD-dependent oxidoreductase [Bradyrhizobium sp. BRP22]
MTRNSLPPSDVDTLDTAIVGAGVAGLYTAWRLLQGGCRPDDIAVFEASERIGGRLFSVNMPGTSGIPAEFGGMRFPANQRLITSLATQLGLAMREFPEGGATSISYARGKRWRAGDLARKQPVPYALRADELYLNPFELIFKAVQQVLPAMKTMEPHEWAKTKESLTLDGRPLINWGFANLLSRFLSDEALQFVEMGLGYSSVVRNWNAADAVSLVIEYVSSPTEKTLVDGTQALPDALAAAAIREGSAIHRRHRLVSLRVPAQTSDDLHELVFATPDGSRTVRAGRVVLALPPRAIELIPDCAALKDSRTAALLATVTPRPLGKIFLAHEEPWWSPLGLTSGRATTDLPIRQIHYFGTEPGRPPGATGYLTLGYFDRPQLDYWAGLRRLEQPSGSGFTMLDPNGPVSAEVRRQIAVVHGLDQPMTAPQSVGFMNWEEDPYGGAWHTWNQGVKSWEVTKEIAAPVPGTALHIVGEAWSTNQGWVEGALETAEAVVGMMTRVRAG